MIRTPNCGWSWRRSSSSPPFKTFAPGRSSRRGSPTAGQHRSRRAAARACCWRTWPSRSSSQPDRASGLSRSPTRALVGGRLYDEHAVACLPCAVLSLTLSGHAGRSLRVWDDVMARQRARGDVRGFALASAFRGYAALHVGDLDAAVADTTAALELARGVPLLRPIAAYATAWLGYALVEAGDYGTAEKVLGAQAATLGPDALFSANYLLSARGRLRLAQGRFAEAAADLRECGRRCAAWGATGPALAPWRAHLALALLASGERDAAASVAADAVALARAWGVSSLLAEALRVAGLVTGGPPGLALLREAVAMADAGESPIERAHARTALGGALRRAGRRSEARQPLREAVEIALATGARAVARAAHEELVATGAKPRRLRQSGAEALTATERRVAGMAADGMSNRGIAQALFVSEKTVETHLGNAYRKLGINARTHLTEALAGTPSGADRGGGLIDGSIRRSWIDHEQWQSEGSLSSNE